MNKAFSFLAIIILSVVIVLSLDLFSDEKESAASRSISVKGIFVLVDEVGLLERLEALSNNNADRHEFLSKARLMLKGEPYVLSSSIRYSWPKDVVIEILEVSPVAIINGSSLLLRGCSVMDIEASQLPVNLAAFDIGERGLSKERCRQIIAVLPMLESMSVTRVSMLSNDDFSLHVGDSRLIVSQENIKLSENKIKRVADLMEAKSIDAEYVDMRYVSGIAIGRVVKL